MIVKLMNAKNRIFSTSYRNNEILVNTELITTVHVSGDISFDEAGHTETGRIIVLPKSRIYFNGEDFIDVVGSLDLLCKVFAGESFKFLDYVYEVAEQTRRERTR